MKNYFHNLLAVALAATVAAAAGSAAAMLDPLQGAPVSAGESRLDRMQAVLGAIDAARPATRAEAERMLDLLERAEADGLSAADRRAAMTALYEELWRFRGFDVEAERPAIRAAAATAAGMFGFGARFSLEVHAPPPGTADGAIDVVRRGHGPVPMLLVSDLQVPAEELYGPFMLRQADRYTMYAVTLPGFGRADVPARPEVMDFGRLSWLDLAERQMADLLVRENLHDVVVIGTSAGGYFSAALAARHPDRIRAAVVVNGLVHAPLRSPADSNRPATRVERQMVASRAVPIELTPAFWPPASREAFRELVENPPPSSGWGDFMAFAIRDAERSRAWTVDLFSAESTWRGARYGAELAATDLTPDLMNLQRPVLVIASLHDRLSPGMGTPVIAQWTELQIRAPEAPVTIATMADVRSYVSLDAPEMFDTALDSLLDGRPITSTTKRAPAALPSPFAATSLHVGASEMQIEYFRPGVKGREIWGALVPYDAMWRTGANDAPMIAFSHDVLVDGQPLAAGTYTLLTIPRPTAWTLIFNRIPHQFGTFFYDPEFDALRLTVAPEEAGMREWFEIAAAPIGPAEAMVALRWEKIRVPFRVTLKEP